MAEPVTSNSTEKLSDRRKLIAVLYADMVGYSRLIGLDDVGTLERLRGLRKDLIDPAIEEHGGRIVNTGGDSLLIVFDSIDGQCAVPSRCSNRCRSTMAINPLIEPSASASASMMS
jgi:class 3 adenylate cyclase